jgi:hypothetical protein
MPAAARERPHRSIITRTPVRDGAQVGLPGADPMAAIVGLPARCFGLLPLLLPGPPPAPGITLNDLGGGGQALTNLRPEPAHRAARRWLPGGYVVSHGATESAEQCGIVTFQLHGGPHTLLMGNLPDAPRASRHFFAAALLESCATVLSAWRSKLPEAVTERSGLRYSCGSGPA